MTTTLYTQSPTDITVTISQIPPRSLLDSYSIISASYCVHEGLQMNAILGLKHKQVQFGLFHLISVFFFHVDFLFLIPRPSLIYTEVLNRF